MRKRLRKYLHSPKEIKTLTWNSSRWMTSQEKIFMNLTDDEQRSAEEILPRWWFFFQFLDLEKKVREDSLDFRKKWGETFSLSRFLILEKYSPLFSFLFLFFLSFSCSCVFLLFWMCKEERERGRELFFNENSMGISVRKWDVKRLRESERNWKSVGEKARKYDWKFNQWIRV